MALYCRWTELALVHLVSTLWSRLLSLYCYRVKSSNLLYDKAKHAVACERLMLMDLS